MEDGKVGEFWTEWFETPRGHWLGWTERKASSILGVAKGKRFLPRFRAFDMLTQPQQSLLVLENADQRIGVESVVGAQTEFRRNIDFQTLYFQFAGHTTIETEFGIYQTHPGELIFIPEGVAQRSTGSADSLRWYFHLREPIREMFDDDKQVSQTEFEVIRHGGPDWKIPADRKEAPKGRITERMIQWRDTSDDWHTIAERDYDQMIDVTSTKRGVKESAIRVLRLFDCFNEITGRQGPGPKPIIGNTFVLEMYNTYGWQRAFHRALRSEEFGIQFGGEGYNLSEFEARTDTLPGHCALVPLGIAHRVFGGPGFLRLVPYTKLPWDPRVDVSMHAYESTFEVKAKVIKPHAWHSQVEAEAAAAKTAAE